MSLKNIVSYLIAVFVWGNTSCIDNNRLKNYELVEARRHLK